MASSAQKRKLLKAEVDRVVWNEGGIAVQYPLRLFRQYTKHGHLPFNPQYPIRLLKVKEVIRVFLHAETDIFTIRQLASRIKRKEGKRFEISRDVHKGIACIKIYRVK